MKPRNSGATGSGNRAGSPWHGAREAGEQNENDGLMPQRRNIIVRALPVPGLIALETEMCEHKGIGHPDTITDGVCEAAARALAQAYLRTAGRVLHFNVDKGLLIAGQSRVRFGGGEVIEPIKLIVCGRATHPGAGFDVGGMVVEAARAFLRKNIRSDLSQIPVIAEVRQGSPSLQQIYSGKASTRVANDTSFGAGYAPYSELEQRVLQLAATLKSGPFRQAFPAAGDDFKIMGLRMDATYTFTLAIAMIDRHVGNVKQYVGIKQAICDHLGRTLPQPCSMVLNALDDVNALDESDLYLTVTGLSAEMGDDGQVGRGNRVNGLITPGRPMSLEAAAGKNPVAHVGKLYNVLAHVTAHTICREIPEVREATVKIVSMIGRPVDQPQAVAVDVSLSSEASPALLDRIRVVVNRQFDGMEELTRQIIHGEIPVY